MCMRDVYLMCMIVLCIHAECYSVLCTLFCAPAGCVAAFLATVFLVWAMSFRARGKKMKLATSGKQNAY